MGSKVQEKPHYPKALGSSPAFGLVKEETKIVANVLSDITVK